MINLIRKRNFENSIKETKEKDRLHSLAELGCNIISMPHTIPSYLTEHEIEERNMKDISEIRRNNLRNLIKQKNLSREELSGLLNMAYSQLAAYIGKTPTKNIGKSVAQRIESKFELPKKLARPRLGH